MKRLLQNEQGFTLAELLIVIAIIGILAAVVLMNMKGSETAAKEAKLKANLNAFRQALIVYHADHGFFPCSPNDFNTNGDVTTFRRQLTWFTNDAGKVSQTRTDQYRFGPYLQSFPENPFYTGNDPSKATNVTIDIASERLLERLQQDVANGSGNCGWYYEAKTGNVVPDLGGSEFSDKYCYF